MVYISFWFMLMMGGSVSIIEKSSEALVVTTKETGLEVNADKTKYIVIFEIRMQDEVTI